MSTKQSVTEPDERNVEVSRRTFLRQSVGSAAVVAGGILATGIGLAGGTAEAREKASKAVAHYRHYPNRGELCGSCVHYRFPFGCGIVRGPISFHGWCRFHERRG
jgi:hypothetical protein